MKKAYSYLRFSTPDQIKGDSLRRQTQATEDWCKRNGVELVQSYRDLGVSAFRGKNAETGALAAFRSLVKKGQIPKGSYLIVESLDRVSRNSLYEAHELFVSLIRAGIIVVTLCDGHIYDVEKTEGGKLMDLIISLTVMSRAHDESQTKALRISASWDAKRRNIGNQKLTGKCVAWLKLSDDKKTFQFIPERVRIVRRIFDMAIHGHGANSIAKTLNREGVPTFGRSGAWFISYIKKILTNRAVIGEFAPTFKRDGKRTSLEVIKDYYPEVVKREVFATVQQIRKVRPSYRGRSSTFNVFSSLVFDRQTETTMSYVNKNRDKGWHYLVPSAALRQQADYTAWQYDEFLAFFLIVCEKAALQEPPDVEADNGQFAVVKTELDETNKQIARLVDFVAKGASAAVESKLRQTEQRKTELQARLNELENESAAKPADIAKINWQDSNRLRENLRATVKRISMDSTKKWFAVEWLDNRPAHIFFMTDSPASVKVRGTGRFKNWKGSKMPLNELLNVAKHKGYLRENYQPKSAGGYAMMYSTDDPSAWAQAN